MEPDTDFDVPAGAILCLLNSHLRFTNTRENSITGGATIMNNAPRSMPAAAVLKDPKIALLQSADNSECSLAADSNTVCFPAETVKEISKTTHASGNSAEEIIADAKRILHCDSQLCVLDSLASRVKNPSRIRLLYFKIKGPALTDTWLNNIDIDEICAQWMAKFPHYKRIPFAMRDFQTHRHTSNGDIPLADFDFLGEYKNGKTQFSCVINTDVYSGGGEHWEAIFVDMSRPTWTVELFNSSGGMPPREFATWLADKATELNTLNPTKLLCEETTIHQKSDTECGVYSLFYVWARLHGITYKQFNTGAIADQHMYTFRRQLFRA